MEAASDFVRHTPQILLVPFIFFFVIAAWIFWWCITAIYVYSVGEAKKGTTPIADI